MKQLVEDLSVSKGDQLVGDLNVSPNPFQYKNCKDLLIGLGHK